MPEDKKFFNADELKELDRNLLSPTPWPTDKRFIPIDSESKFIGAGAGTDIPDMYGTAQSNAERTFNGIFRLGQAIVSDFAKGAGFLYQLPIQAGKALSGDPDATFSNVFNEAADTGWNRWWENADEKWKEKLFPIFKTNNFESKSVMAQLGSMQFWASDAVDGLAFMISTMIPGAIMTKLGWFSKLGIGTGRMINSLATASRVGKPIANIEKFARGFEKLSFAASMTVQEAMFEGVDTRDQVLAHLMPKVVAGEINPNTGVPWTEQAAKQEAGKQGMNTYFMNLMALAPSNLLEANLLFKRLLPKRRAIGFEGTKAVKTAPKTRFGRISEKPVTRISKSLLAGAYSEGFWEENIQYSIQKINEYDAMLYGEGVEGIPFWQKALSSLKSVTPGMGLIENLADPERGKNVMLGSILGTLYGARSGVRQVKHDKKYVEGAVQAINNGYSAFMGVDVRKREPDIETNYGVEEVEGTKAYFKQETGKNKVIMSEADWKYEVQQKGVDPINGGKHVERGKVIFDEKDKVQIDEAAATKFAESLGFIQHLDNMIYAEESSKKKNLARLGFLKDVSFAEWALAHFQVDMATEFMDRLKDWKSVSPEDAMNFGVDPMSNDNVQLDILERVEQAKQLYDHYQNNESSFLPRKNTKGAITENAERKKYAFKTVAKIMSLGKNITEQKAALNKLQEDIGETDSELNDINNKTYRYQYELLKKARNDTLGDTTGVKSEKELNALEDEIVEAKREYNERNKDNKDIKKIEEDTSVVRNINNPLAFEAERLNVVIADMESAKEDMEQLYADLSSFKKYKAHRETKETEPVLEITDDTSTLQYERYEALALRRAQFRENIDTLKADFQGQKIGRLIDEGADILGVLNSILSGDIKLPQEYFNILNEQIKEVRARIKEIENEIKINPEEFTQLSKELAALEAIIEKWENIKANKNKYFGDFKSSTPLELRHNVMEEALAPATTLHWLLEQDIEGYDNVEKLENVIKLAKNIKRIFSERKELLKDAPFDTLLARLDSMIETLEKNLIVVKENKARNEAKDIAALNDATTMGYGSFGLDYKKLKDGNKVEDSVLNRELYDFFVEHVPDFLTIAAKKELIAVETVYQALRDVFDGDPQLKKNLEDIINNIKGDIAEWLEEELKKTEITPTLIAPLSHSIEEVGEFNTIQTILNNPMDALMTLIQGTLFKEDWNIKGSPAYNFKQNRVIVTLLEDIEKENPKFLSLVELIISSKALNDLQNEIDSEYNLVYELTQEAAIADHVVKDKDAPFIFKPTNQQLMALRAFNSWYHSKVGNALFEGFAYINGFGGTGKTAVFAKWLFKVLNLTTENTYLAGVTGTAAETLSDSLTNGVVAPRTIESLLEDLTKNPEIFNEVKLIIVDEIGQASIENIIALRNMVNKLNKDRKDPVRVLMMGDPNQGSADQINPAPLEIFNNAKGYGNIYRLNPLTVFHRSAVVEVNEIVNLFLDNVSDLTKDILKVASNTENPQSNNLALFGVNGTSNDKFIENVKGIIANRVGDGRRRVIVVSPGYEKKYNDAFSEEIENGQVEVYNYIDVQSLTVDEVYVDINPKDSHSADTSLRNKHFNTNMYTATSRARYYVYMGNMNISHNPNTQITAPTQEENTDKSRADLKEFAKKIKQDREFVEQMLNLEPEEKTEEEMEEEMKEDEKEVKETEPETEVENVEDVEGEIEVMDDVFDEDETEEYDEVTQQTAEPVVIEKTKPTFFQTVYGNLKSIVNKGDKVLFVVSSYKEKDYDRKRTIIIVKEQKIASGYGYVEVARVSKSDPVIPGFEKIYKKFANLLDEAVKPEDPVFFEHTSSTRKKTILALKNNERIKPKDILYNGKIDTVNKLKFHYVFKGVPHKTTDFKRSIVTSFVNSLYPKKIYGKMWGRDYNKIIKKVIDSALVSEDTRFHIFRARDFKDKDGEFFGLDNIKLGWPHLIVNMELPNSGATKSFYLRGKFKALSPKNENLRMVYEFIDTAQQAQDMFHKLNPNMKSLIFAHPVFTRIIDSLANGTFSKEFRDEKGEIQSGAVNEILRTLGNANENLPKVRAAITDYSLKGILTHTYGGVKTNKEFTKLAKRLINMLVEKDEEGGDHHGPAQIAFNRLALANRIANGVILQSIRKGTVKEGRPLMIKYASRKGTVGLTEANGIFKVIGNYYKKQGEIHKNNPAKLQELKEEEKALRATRGMLTLDELRQAFSDPSTLVTPVNAYTFNNMDDKNGTYVENTFSHVTPSHITIDFIDNDKVSRTKEDKEKPIPKDDKPWRNIRRFGAKGKLGIKVSKKAIINHIKKRIPDIDKRNIRFVTPEFITELNDGEFSWGLYKDGIIYFVENKDGTVYENVARHELFHKIWGIIPMEYKNSIIDEIIAREPFMRRRENEDTEIWLERVEEYLAREYHLYKQGHISLAGKIREFFDWVTSLFGLLKSNLSEIDNLFRMINHGEFSDMEGITEQLPKGFSSIDDYAKSSYDAFTLYTEARELVVSTIHKYWRPYGKVILDADGASNIPKYLSDAINSTFRDIQSWRERLLATKDEWDVAEPDSDQQQDNLTYNAVTALTGLSESANKINKNEFTSVFRDMIRDIYPSIKFNKNAVVEEVDQDETEDTETSQPNIQDDEIETENIIKSLDTEQIDHKAKLTVRVKSFLSNIYNHQLERLVPFNEAYFKIMHTMEMFFWDNAFVTLKNGELRHKIIDVLTETFKHTTNNDAIVETMKNLIDDAYHKGDTSMRFDNDNLFVFSKDGSDISGIYPSQYDANIVRVELTDNATADYEAILNAMGREFTQENLQAIADVYNKFLAGDILKEFQIHMGSLYKQDVYKGSKKLDFKAGGFIFNYQPDFIKGRKIRARTILYAKLIDAFNAKNKFIDPKVIEEYNNPKDREEERGNKLLNSILKGIGIHYDVYSKTPWAALENFMKVYDSVGEKMSEEKLIDKIYTDSSGYLDFMVEAIDDAIPFTQKTSSYKRGDGKKAYMHIRSNFGIENIKRIIRGDLPSFLANSYPTNFFSFNIFNKKSLGRQINKIHRVINHDSTYEKGNEYNFKDIRQETRTDTLSRLLNFMFLSSVKRTRSTTVLRYMQPFWNIGEKKKVYGAEINVLKENDADNVHMVRNAIRQAIKQEAHKEKTVNDNPVWMSNRKKSYLPGMKSILERKNMNEEEWNRYVDRHVDIVYNQMLKQADEFYEKVRGNEIWYSAEMKKIINMFHNMGYTPFEFKPEKFYIKVGERRGTSKEQVEAAKKWDKRMDDYIKPIVRVFYTNYYINSFFLNQLAVGDQANFKNTEDLHKRIQIAFADKYRPMVGELGMKATFTVAVGQDVKRILGGPEWNKFKKVVGMSFDQTDGASFITPERYEDIKRGMPQSWISGAVLKPVYAGLDVTGRFITLKYSSVVLTDELVKAFPKLAKLREDMRNEKIDEFVFNTAMKTGVTANIIPVNKNGLHNLKGTKGKMVLDNNNYGLQLNPKQSIDITIKNSSQMMFHVNADGKNPVEAARIFKNVSKIMELRLNTIVGKYKITKKEEYASTDHNLLDKIRRGFLGVLKPIKGLARISQILGSKTDGKYDVSINLPVLANKLTVQMASMFNNNVIELRFPGADLIMQSEYGTMKGKGLKFRDKDGLTECIMPDIYQGIFKEGDIIWSNSIVGFRIPGTGKHSVMALKVKKFYPSQGENVIIVPEEFVFTAGPDFDIDTVFVIRKEIARKDFISSKGIKIVVKGKPFKYSERKLAALEIDLKDLKHQLTIRGKEDKSEIVKKIRDYEEIIINMLKNDIVDQYLKVFKDQANDESMTMPIFMNLIENKDAIEGLDQTIMDMLREIKGGSIEIHRDPADPYDEMEMHQDAHGAVMLKGRTVNMQKGLSYAYQSNTGKTDPLMLKKVHFTVDGNYHDRLNKHEVESTTQTKKTPDTQIKEGVSELFESKPKQADIRVTKTQKEKINIYWGANENAHLSNFAERPYSDPLGVTFRNVESAFQYTKTNYADGDNDAIRLKLQSTTGAEAKKLGRQIKGLDLEVWDKNSSVIMKEIIKESFEQNPEALQKLLDTGDAELTHTQDKGKWKTEFPRLLMEVREELSTGTYKGQQGTISTEMTESTSEEKESPDIQIKEGVSELFESNPELAKIGTQEQYSQYLDTIFPDSKVKDIVYHGTSYRNRKNLLSQSKYNFDLAGTEFGYKSEGAFFTPINHLFGKGTDDFGFYNTRDYGSDVVAALININNTEKHYPFDQKGIDSENRTYLGKRDDLRKDSITAIRGFKEFENYEKNPVGFYVVFKPEQIHILGSKQDIGGFKEHVKKEEGKAVVEEKDVLQSLKITNKKTVVNVVDGKKISHEFRIMDLLDVITNMTIDNMNFLYLSKINFNNVTVESYIGLLASGVSLKRAVIIMMQPVFRNAGKQLWADSGIAKAEAHLKELYIKKTKATEEEVKDIFDKLKSVNENVDTTALREFVYKETDELTAEEIKTQIKLIGLFKKVNEIGKEIGNISKAVTAAQRIDSFYNQIVKRLGFFDNIFRIKDGREVPIPGKPGHYELKKGFLFPEVQLRTLPHINSAVRVLKILKSKLENIFFKHNRDLTAFSKSVYSWITQGGVNIYFKKDKDEQTQFINEEFIRYLQSNVKYGDDYTFDTSEEAEYIHKARGKERSYFGVEAWSQRFIDNVKALKAELQFQNNEYLDLLETPIGEYGLAHITMSTISDRSPIEIMALQRKFEALVRTIKADPELNEKYKDIDRDFVKYAALNWGMAYGGMNYTMTLPPRLLAEVSKALDNSFESIFLENKDTLDDKLDMLREHFAFQLAYNNIDKMKMPSGLERRDDGTLAGVDVVNGITIFYSRKYKVEEGRDFETMPNLIGDGRRLYVKSIQGDLVGAEYVYYNTVGLVDQHGSYQFNKDILTTGYSPGSVYDGSMYLLTSDSVLKDKMQVSTFYREHIHKHIPKGSSIIVKNKSDQVGTNAQIYEVKGIDYRTVIIKGEKVKKIEFRLETKGSIVPKQTAPESTISNTAAKVILEKLKKRFNIEYEYDTTLDRIGRFKNGKVYINPNLIKTDTPFHEYAHPFIRAVRLYNIPLYKNLKKEILAEKKILKKVEAKYPDYSSQDQIEEAIVTAIGLYSADKISKKTGKPLIAAIRAFAKWVTKELKALFNKKGLTVQELPMDMNLQQLSDFLIFGTGTVAFENAPVDAESRLKNELYEERINDWNMNNGIWFSPYKQGIMDKYKALVKLYGKSNVYTPLRMPNGTWAIRVKKPIQPERAAEVDIYRGESSASRKDRLLSEEMLRMQDKEWDSRQLDDNYMEDLQRDNERADLKLIEVEKDEDSYYEDGNKTRYERLTEKMYEVFSRAKRIKEIVENRVRKMIANKPQGVDGKYQFPDGSEFTPEELIDKQMEDAEAYRLSGNIAHAMIQLMFVTDPFVRRELEYKVKKWAQTVNETGVYRDNILERLRFIEENKEKIMESIGVNIFSKDVSAEVLDQAYSEIMISNDPLKIATTIDLMIRHSNNQYSLYDFKAGAGFFSDGYINYLMKYGDRQLSNIEDNKENRAKLELALRAFMLKAKYPHLMFRNIQVVHLNKDTFAKPLDVSMTLYLGMIEHWMMDPANKMQNLHKTYKKMGLFNPLNYSGYDTSAKEHMDDENLDHAEKLEKYNGELQTLKYQKKKQNKIYENMKNDASKKKEAYMVWLGIQKIKKREEEVYDMLTALHADKNANKDMNFDKHDMNGWEGLITNLQYDPSHPIAQAFGTMVHKGRDLIKLKKRNLEREYKEHILPVIKEYRKSHGLFDSPSEKGLMKWLSSTNYMEFWKFMWTYRSDTGRVGYVWSTSKNYVDKKGNVHTMTDAQWVFNQWIRNKVHGEWKRIMGRNLEDIHDREITVAMAMGMPNELLEDFAPRSPMTRGDVVERNGLLSTDVVNDQLRRMRGWFLKSIDANTRPRDMVPLKYMENERIMESENHTFSIEDALYNFMDNLYTKEHFDPLVTYGLILANKLKLGEEKDGIALPNLGKFIEDYVHFHLLKLGNPDKSRGIRFTFKNKDGTTDEMKLSSVQIAKTLKVWTSMQVIWFKLVAPTFNTIFLTGLGIKEGLKGSIASLFDESLGIDYNDIDFTLENMYEFLVEEIQFQKKLILGDENNKLKLLLEHLDYYSDNFDWKVRRNRRLVGKTKLADDAIMYFTYRVGEDFGSRMFLVSQLKHARANPLDPNSKSIYDSYDAENGKLVWKGGVRGVQEMADGSIIKIEGLTTEEVIKLKRIYQRIMGSYKEEEKYLLEKWAIGILAAIYRRYLPAIVKNATDKGKMEKAMGKFMPVMDQYGNIKMLEGETVYGWMDRYNKGKARVVLGLTWASSQVMANNFGATTNVNMAKTWKGLHPEEKLQVIDVGIIALMFLSYIGFIRPGFDDDDKNKALVIRLNRLITEDMTQGLNPIDLIRNLQQPLITINKVFDAIQGWTMWLEGKDETDDFIPGRTLRMKSFPFTSTMAELDKYFLNQRTGKDLFGWFNINEKMVR